MLYEELVSPEQGNYIIASDIEFENLIEKKPLPIKGLEVYPGEITTLYDWFIKPCRYVGMMGNAAIFYIADRCIYTESDVSFVYFYDKTYIIGDNLIFKNYNYRSGRSYKLKGGNNPSWFNNKKAV